MGTWNGETAVALKRLKDSSQIAAFLKEAQTLSALSHPNVVHLYGLYTASTGEKFLVTEYLSRGIKRKKMRKMINILMKKISKRFFLVSNKRI